MSTQSQPFMRGAFSPTEPIPGLPGRNIGHFWSWAYSNLQENTVRPAFAEFMVGALLGVASDGRKVWDGVDLRYGDHSIEVKSSAYVQAWQQRQPSRIQFDIARKLAWDHDSNTTVEEPVRPADCYVFCLHREKDEDKANPLDVSSWCFWVLSTARINEVFGGQQSVVLSRIEALTDPVTAADLRRTVHEVLDMDRPK